MSDGLEGLVNQHGGVTGLARLLASQHPAFDASAEPQPPAMPDPYATQTAATGLGLDPTAQGLPSAPQPVQYDKDALVQQLLSGQVPTAAPGFKHPKMALIAAALNPTLAPFVERQMDEPQRRADAVFANRQNNIRTLLGLEQKQYQPIAGTADTYDPSTGLRKSYGVPEDRLRGTVVGAQGAYIPPGATVPSYVNPSTRPSQQNLNRYANTSEGILDKQTGKILSPKDHRVQIFAEFAREAMKDPGVQLEDDPVAAAERRASGMLEVMEKKFPGMMQANKITWEGGGEDSTKIQKQTPDAIVLRLTERGNKTTVEEFTREMRAQGYTDDQIRQFAMKYKSRLQ